MAARPNGTTATTKTPARTSVPAAANRPRPIPRDVRSAATSMATLGDPTRLAILGLLAGGESLALDAIATLFGIDADAATATLGQLKKRGFVEASRVAGVGWTYRISEAGVKAWTRAQGFGG